MTVQNYSAEDNNLLHIYSSKDAVIFSANIAGSADSGDQTLGPAALYEITIGNQGTTGSSPFSITSSGGTTVWYYSSVPANGVAIVQFKTTESALVIRVGNGSSNTIFATINRVD